MKKIILFALLWFSISSQAQTINNIPLADIDVPYVEIVGTQKFMSSQLVITLNFGQRNRFFKGLRDNMILDADGTAVTFNSMIDALNFMSVNGYEFVQAYAITVNSNSNVYHYLLRKKETK